MTSRRRLRNIASKSEESAQFWSSFKRSLSAVCFCFLHLLCIRPLAPVTYFLSINEQFQGTCTTAQLAVANVIIIIIYYYGPGDAIARVSRSSMVALHTLLSCVLHVTSCSVRCSSLQSSLIMSIHLFFCLPLFLVPCTYPLYAILGYRSFFIRFRCPKYRSPCMTLSSQEKPLFQK